MYIYVGLVVSSTCAHKLKFHNPGGISKTDGSFGGVMKFAINIGFDTVDTNETNVDSDNPSGRRFCGEGEFDIKGFIKSVQKTGYNGPWALEVFNKDYTCLSLEELCTRGYNSTIAEFID